MTNTALFQWFYGAFGNPYSWDDLIFIPRFILEKLENAKEKGDEAEFCEILDIVTVPNQVILQKIQQLQGSGPPAPEKQILTVPGTYIDPNPPNMDLQVKEEPSEIDENDPSQLMTGFDVNITGGKIDVQE